MIADVVESDSRRDRGHGQHAGLWALDEYQIRERALPEAHTVGGTYAVNAVAGTVSNRAARIDTGAQLLADGAALAASASVTILGSPLHATDALIEQSLDVDPLTVQPPFRLRRPRLDHEDDADDADRDE